MRTGPCQRPEPVLTLAQAAEALGQDEDSVLADAANGSLTWAVTDGETLYPEATVLALAARRSEPPEDPLLTRSQAGYLLGITGSAVSRLTEGGKLAREPAVPGNASYRRSAVLAYRDRRDAARPPAPRPPGALTAAEVAEVARAQAARRARQERS